jgi:hypothetical protein
MIATTTAMTPRYGAEPSVTTYIQRRLLPHPGRMIRLAGSSPVGAR